jgi:hypothetical protein
VSRLIPPLRYAEGDGLYHFELINSPSGSGGGAGNPSEFVLYTVPDGQAAIVRFANVVFIGGGSVGTFTASLYGLYTFGIDASGGFGGELTAPSGASFLSGSQGRITWSTDVDTAYEGPDSNWSKLAQAPLPITYLPETSKVSVNFLPAAGADASVYIDFAQLVVELFHYQGSGSSYTGPTYLLPAGV